MTIRRTSADKACRQLAGPEAGNSCQGIPLNQQSIGRSRFLGSPNAAKPTSMMDPAPHLPYPRIFADRSGRTANLARSALGAARRSVPPGKAPCGKFRIEKPATACLGATFRRLRPAESKCHSHSGPNWMIQRPQPQPLLCGRCSQPAKQRSSTTAAQISSLVNTGHTDWEPFEAGRPDRMGRSARRRDRHEASQAFHQLHPHGPDRR